ncbi:hypothetical protein [Roseivivax isoporae]|uniref:hypothetical protein n=1 Tax=Roseivivax isoporae TaxID=591206 RepID=UPI0012EB0570|nr:hypothetical protein [Roseivivax isoporae]
MTDVQHIAKKIGQRRLAERLGVGVTAVNNAVQRDKVFPASWYPIVKEACEEVELACPMEAFRWREPKQEDAA